MQPEIVIISDASELLSAGRLAGVHQVVTCDADIHEALKSVTTELDSSRLFVYFHGLNRVEVDNRAIKALRLLKADIRGYAPLKGHINSLYSRIADKLTMKQYKEWSGRATYREIFQRALQVSKSKQIHAWAHHGIRLCDLAERINKRGAT
jgi:hypothetical protein